jgi:hypothetical protein
LTNFRVQLALANFIKYSAKTCFRYFNTTVYLSIINLWLQVKIDGPIGQTIANLKIDISEEKLDFERELTDESIEEVWAQVTKLDSEDKKRY